MALRMEAALKRFQELHPDVETELVKPQTLPGEEDDPRSSYASLQAQLMAGEGPDIMLLEDNYLEMEIEKLVRQGIFADMEPYFQADGFDWEPYYQGVMDAGVWNGKRFLFPLGYKYPLLSTTKAALEETGFNIEACKDFQGFLEETARYMADPSQTRRLFSDAKVLGATPYELRAYSGLPIVDYDEKTADLSSPQFQTLVHWYKTVVDTHPDDPAFYSSIGSASAVRDGQALWNSSVLGADMDLYFSAGALRTLGEVVMLPIRDINGGVRVQISYSVAVRANSENLENAYDYLKILLSPEIQAINPYQFSILKALNESYLSGNSTLHVPEGTDGFFSTNHPGTATNDPNPEEIQRVLAYTEEITGGYYHAQYEPMLFMYPYFYFGEDYEETLNAAQSHMDLYLSE